MAGPDSFQKFAASTIATLRTINNYYLGRRAEKKFAMIG